MSSAQNQHDFERRVVESWPGREWCGSHVVLGVSGGADSVAMLRAVASIKNGHGGDGRVFVAHLHHGLRGSAADEDAAWLEALCGRLNVPLEVGRADVAAIAAEQGDGMEAAARTVRYDFLRRAAERVGARFVATAHTADDQVETVLHRILRGTGIEGLAGMPKVRPISASVALVRPMLSLWRRDVLEYLAAIGQDFRTDESNADTQWTRNRLRHELLPQLRERFNPKVDVALERLASQANEAQQLLTELAADLARDCITVAKMGVRIDCDKLMTQPRLLVREVCKIAWSRAGWPQQSMGFEQWQQLAALVGNSPSSGHGESPATTGPLPKEESSQEIINLPANIRARREERFLVLEILI